MLWSSLRFKSKHKYNNNNINNDDDDNVFEACNVDSYLGAVP